MAKKVTARIKNIGINKLPPQSIETEVSVLGSLILDKDAIVKIADILNDPDDFYEPKNGIIFECILDLFEKRRPIDLVTLANKLEEKSKLEEIGGASYLASLTDSVPSAAHITHYAQIVTDKAALRRLIKAASDITSFGYNESDPIGDTLDKAEKTLFEVSQKHLKQNFISLKSVLADSFDRIDDLHKDKEKLRGVPTGFSGIDNLLAGLQPADLIIIAGRPSMGKTSLALNIAQHVAAKEGIPVGIFSLEMSKEQLIDRLLCVEAKIDSWKLRTGNLDDDDFPRIGHAMAILSEAPLYIDDSATSNVLEMRTKARRLQMEKGLGLLVIDYLQLMTGRNTESRVQEISEISRSLKALARELNIPVIAISQLSRAVESRPSRIPQLADLRESGSIEQDADVVMFVYREDYYDKETERENLADIMVKKHRNGPTGDIELFFVPEQMAFQTIDKKRKEE